MKQLLYVLAIVSMIVPAFCAVDTAEIAAVREKAAGASSSVSDSDKAVIAKFWRTGLDRMFLAEESQEVVEVRRQLKEQKGPDNLSLYATAYIEEALKDIQVSFATVDKIEVPAKKVLVNRNLMILAAELQNAKLSPLALARLGDPDEVVRYWAVKAVTQPVVAEQLTKSVTPDPQMTEAILKALKERVLIEPRPEITEMMIGFAGAVDHAIAREMLSSFADSRIAAYKNWTIKNEQLEITLLNSLGSTASAQQGEIKSQFGRKFAELYALVFQRYLKGQTLLTADNLEQLVAVIVEVDQGFIKSLPIQTNVPRAIQQKRGLDREYDTLFGNRMMGGELAARLRFDYGKDSTGKAMTAPPEIGPAPAPEAVASK